MVNGEVGHAAHSNKPLRTAAIKKRNRFTKNVYIMTKAGFSVTVVSMLPVIKWL